MGETGTDGIVMDGSHQSNHPRVEDQLVFLNGQSYTYGASLRYIQSRPQRERYDLCLHVIDQIDATRFHGEEAREHIYKLVEDEKLWEGQCSYELHRKIFSDSRKKVGEHRSEKQKILAAQKRIIELWGEEAYNRILRPIRGHVAFKFYEAVRAFALACRDWPRAARVILSCFYDRHCNRTVGQKAVPTTMPGDWRKALEKWKTSPEDIYGDVELQKNPLVKELYSTLLPETPSNPLPADTLNDSTTIEIGAVGTGTSASGPLGSGPVSNSDLPDLEMILPRLRKRRQEQPARNTAGGRRDESPSPSSLSSPATPSQISSQPDSPRPDGDEASSSKGQLNPFLTNIYTY